VAGAVKRGWVGGEEEEAGGEGEGEDGEKDLGSSTRL
jgi:hypothetical protein